MTADFNQDNRMGRLNTVLGPNALALMRFEGTDRMNGLFDYQVSCLSQDPKVDFDKLLGTHATVTITTRGGDKRRFDGIVTEARWLGSGDNGMRYVLRLQPWFWLASLRRNQRIFHNMTVTDIVQQVLLDYASAGEPELKLSASYPELEYTVQYRESDLDFVSRMLERFGISYHFKHEDGAHKMVLTDIVDEHDTIGDLPYLPFTGHHQEDIEHLSEWAPAQRITTGAIRLTDFNFKTPVAAMEANQSGDAAYSQGQIESFDYPGDYLEQGRGRTLASLALSRERGQGARFAATGDAPQLGSGLRMTLTGETHAPGAGEEYLCLVATHSYTSDNYGSGGSGGDGTAFAGQYVLMPTAAPMVPERKTRRGMVQGPQTATVVGDGEIDCDEHGRILVKFHWDLDGANSMRCRVSQAWAGNGWGSMMIPRIGWEVVVEFIEGDPDQPLVTGCVYNGKNKPPYDLPANKTRAVWKSDTHQGSGYNEIRFEDKAGEEEVFLHGQKDMNLVIEHNQTEKVGVNMSLQVGNDRSDTIGHDHTETIGNDSTTAIAKNRSDTVGVNAVETIGANYSLTVGSAMNATVGAAYAMEIGAASSTAIAASESVTVGGSSSHTIGGSFTLDASDEIKLLCGSSSIVMKRNGDITISGNNISIKGSGKISAKASSTMTLKAAKIAQN